MRFCVAFKEQKLWDSYQKYYQIAIQKTTRPQAPWFIIPADNKPASRLIVGSILEEVLLAYNDIQNPELSESVKQNLDEYRRQLESEEN